MLLNAVQLADRICVGMIESAGAACTLVYVWRH